MLLGASLTYALMRAERHSPMGFVIVVSGAVIACLNFYLSIVRYRLQARERVSRADFRHVSGFPVIGTIIIVVGALLGFGCAACAVLGLVAIALDTGGAPWFLASTWNDAVLWNDAER
ncbi:hypothetical protein AKJ09_09780 [Labilithrix luteola]|uniref:Uncharacterized protein n=1 Tax=Labilithrix luteola TaxID=1391654 RepID=A0A0K1QBR7_9BACT|nr:hypothetical protein AKJ09_09780 [Labilithrix luteola]